MLFEILNFILGMFMIACMGFFTYMSSHMVSEKKAGRTIPLPWEKKSDVFDKSKVKYFDGDNT